MGSIESSNSPLLYIPFSLSKTPNPKLSLFPLQLFLKPLTLKTPKPSFFPNGLRHGSPLLRARPHKASSAHTRHHYRRRRHCCCHGQNHHTQNPSFCSLSPSHQRPSHQGERPRPPRPNAGALRSPHIPADARTGSPLRRRDHRVATPTSRAFNHRRHWLRHSPCHHLLHFVPDSLLLCPLRPLPDSATLGRERRACNVLYGSAAAIAAAELSTRLVSAYGIGLRRGE